MRNQNEKPDPKIYGNQTTTPTGQHSFKLSREARNNLPDEVFCGPNRTLPVPDERHVGIAKGRIAQMPDGPAKDKAKQCVNAKQQEFDRAAGRQM